MFFDNVYGELAWGEDNYTASSNIAIIMRIIVRQPIDSVSIKQPIDTLNINSQDR